MRKYGEMDTLKCLNDSAESLICVLLFGTPWIVAHQTPAHGIFQARILEWVVVHGLYYIEFLVQRSLVQNQVETDFQKPKGLC